MESPPRMAITPESGTAMEASGTPCDAAKAIVWLEKWFGPAIRKISAKNKRPSRTTGPAIAGAWLWDSERVEKVAAVAIMFSPFGLVGFNFFKSWIVRRQRPSAAKAARTGTRAYGTALPKTRRGHGRSHGLPNPGVGTAEGVAFPSLFVVNARQWCSRPPRAGSGLWRPPSQSRPGRQASDFPRG